MTKQSFFETYHLTDDDLLEAHITWEELTLIAEDYRKIEGYLREISKSFIENFGACENAIIANISASG